jgi:hypothetical protein
MIFNLGPRFLALGPWSIIKDDYKFFGGIEILGNRK